MLQHELCYLKLVATLAALDTTFAYAASVPNALLLSCTRCMPFACVDWESVDESFRLQLVRDLGTYWLTQFGWHFPGSRTSWKLGGH